MGALLLVVPLVACGTAAAPEAGPSARQPAPTSVATPTTTTTRRLPPDTDLKPVCEGESFPDAAAYTGPPPHPTQFFGFSYRYGDLYQWPDPWGTWEPGKIDAALVQFALCEERQEPEPTDQVCRYKPEFGSGKTQSFTLALDVSTVRLYEVKTGKLLTEARVSGPRQCPGATVVQPGDTTVSSLIDVELYANAVRQFVLG